MKISKSNKLVFGIGAFLIAASLILIFLLRSPLHEIARAELDQLIQAKGIKPPEQCSALYQTWIRRSCLEDYADAVWVAEIAGQPAGYVTCHLDQQAKDGSIGLVGIAEQARGQKVGEQLVKRALDWFAGQGMATVSVVTQGSNIAAQRLYQKCGFASRSLQLWYHKWYVNPASPEVIEGVGLQKEHTAL